VLGDTPDLTLGKEFRTMSSPRIMLSAAIALSALATPAFAGDNEDRAAAMVACKSAVAQQLQVDVTGVRLERIKTKGRVIEMRLDARKDGARVAFADCTYTRRSGETNVVVAQPAQQRASN
jgi:hypothetical protein